jgi:hypothetical protein
MRSDQIRSAKVHSAHTSGRVAYIQRGAQRERERERRERERGVVQ